MRTAANLKGSAEDATRLAAANAKRLYPHVAAGRPIVFCEPSCLSAVREDAPSLLRGEARRKAEAVANATVLFEEFAGTIVSRLTLSPGPATILLHGHCHQKSMGLVAFGERLAVEDSRHDGRRRSTQAAAAWLARGDTHVTTSTSRAPSVSASCFPLSDQRATGTIVAAAGTSCRHQLRDFTGVEAVHPAVLLQSLLTKAHTA